MNLFTFREERRKPNCTSLPSIYGWRWALVLEGTMKRGPAAWFGFERQYRDVDKENWRPVGEYAYAQFNSHPRSWWPVWDSFWYDGPHKRISLGPFQLIWSF